MEFPLDIFLWPKKTMEGPRNSIWFPKIKCVKWILMDLLEFGDLEMVRKWLEDVPDLLRGSTL